MTLRFGILIISLFLITSTSFGQNSKFETVEIKTEIFCDHCLRCESCYTNIFYTVKKQVKGIKKIDVNPETNTITVKYKTTLTNLEKIEEAITSAGYKANERPAKPIAYQNLEACCKKAN